MRHRAQIHRSNGRRWDGTHVVGVNNTVSRLASRGFKPCPGTTLTRRYLARMQPPRLHSPLCYRCCVCYRCLFRLPDLLATPVVISCKQTDYDNQHQRLSTQHMQSWRVYPGKTRSLPRPSLIITSSSLIPERGLHGHCCIRNMMRNRRVAYQPTKVLPKLCSQFFGGNAGAERLRVDLSWAVTADTSAYRCAAHRQSTVVVEIKEKTLCAAGSP